MVFKRRDPRSLGQLLLGIIWPKGGWARAFEYVKLRLRRLPDPPHRIARGIWAGVFTTFTPFYGLHFLIAAVIALVLRGNVIASLLATFFGNPLTYLPIGVISLQTGHWLLGSRLAPDMEASLFDTFRGAWRDLWHNFMAMFTPEEAHWEGLARFWDQVFLPYLIGGIIPGVVAATILYYLSVPVITAYQNRRKGLIKEKLANLKAKAAKKPGPGKPVD